MRLHKFIANCGYTSRRRAELLIQAGRVTVNGKVVRGLGAKVRPDRDSVAINGETISLPAPLTIALNKPAGIITSTHDTHERLTVMDLLPRTVQQLGVVPAGRLDQDTEGLLVLTNDGDLGHRITHPRYETEKEYEAVVRGQPSQRALKRLEGGVLLEGERTAPARIAQVEASGGLTTVHIVIREGKKRQVRRMFAAIGHEVVHLSRRRIGRLHLGDLPLGEWRELSSEEIADLVGGPDPESDPAKPPSAG